MKAGNVSQGSNPLLRQAKLVREEKAPSKKEQNAPVEEKIDLSTRTSVLSPHVPPTYEEVLDLLYRTDFKQLGEVDWISQEGRSGLQALL